jgi:hypothetical protein
MIFLFFFISILFSQESRPIVAHAMAVDGVVRARNESQEERVLNKGANLFLLDLITVDPDSKMEIKFTDGSLLNLISNTQYQIDQYQYRVPKQKDRFTGQLLQGTLRLLSGSIAKKNPNEYEIRTPSATIGLRGTTIEASVIGVQLYVGVTEGAAFVMNSAGKTLIGPQAETQFAFVPSQAAAPQAVSLRPPELNIQFFTPATAPLPPTIEAAPKAKEAGPKISETNEPTSSGTPSATGGTAIQGGC